MQVKRYLVLSITLLAALGIVIYINDSSNYTANFGGVDYTFPIAVWALAPALIVFLVSFSHIAFYSAATFFSRSAIEKDMKTLKRLVQNALLGQKSMLTLKTSALAPLGKILSFSQIKPLAENERCGDSDLDATLAIVDRVSRGESADFGVLTPSKDSPVWIAAQLIKLKSDPRASEELLFSAPVGSEVYFKALEIYAAYGDKKRFLKNETVLNQAAALNLLSRFGAAQNSLEFTPQEIITIAGRAAFCAKDFLVLARSLKAKITPDAMLELFAQLKNAFDAASGAWLYVNIELERQDEAQSILQNADRDEFTQFRAYFALKDAGMPFKLDSLLSCAF